MWEDVLKNQIQVGQQKLRSSKRPLPDDGKTCRELWEEAVDEIKKFIRGIDTETFYTQSSWDDKERYESETYMTTESSRYGFDVTVRFYHHSNLRQTEEFYCALLNSDPVYEFANGSFAGRPNDKLHVIRGKNLVFGGGLTHISYFIQFIPVGKKPRGYNTSLRRIVMDWENTLKNVITVPKQKLRTSKRPLPDEEDDDCYNWLLRLGDVVAPIVDKNTENVWVLESRDKVPEAAACAIKDIIQNITFNRFEQMVTESGQRPLGYTLPYDLDYDIKVYGELLDIKFGIHQHMEYVFKMELTFAPAPVGNYEAGYTSILPVLFNRTKVLSKEDDVEGLINLGILDKSSTYVFIEDYEDIIKSGINDINRFNNYIKNDSIKRWIHTQSTIIIASGEVYRGDNGIQPVSEAHSKLMTYLDMLK